MEQKFDPIEIHDPLKVYGTIADHRGVIKPYKVYVAKITVVNDVISDPVILQNTLGNIVWSGGGAVITGTLTGQFTVDKTVCFFTGSHLVSQATATFSDNSHIEIVAYDNGGFTLQDFIIFIEIRVYD